MVSFECCQFLFSIREKTNFVRILSMSLFKLFEPVKDKAKGTCSDASSIVSSLSNKDENDIYREELMIISEELEDTDDNNETTTSSKRAISKDVVKIRKLYESLKVTSLNLMNAQ